MALSENTIDDKDTSLSPPVFATGTAVPVNQGSLPSKSLTAARALLTSLQPHIQDILKAAPSSALSAADDDRDASRKLNVKLNVMNIMRPERPRGNKKEKGEEGVYGRVLWIGPDVEDINDEDTKRLRDVCSTSISFPLLTTIMSWQLVIALINKKFTEAGLAVDEKRPLKVRSDLLRLLCF